MHIHVHVHIHIHIHIHIYIYIYTYVYTHTHIHMTRACARVCMRACVCAFVHVCVCRREEDAEVGMVRVWVEEVSTCMEPIIRNMVLLILDSVFPPKLRLN
jgi:hypothetical protein